MQSTSDVVAHNNNVSSMSCSACVVVVCDNVDVVVCRVVVCYNIHTNLDTVRLKVVAHNDAWV